MFSASFLFVETKRLYDCASGSKGYDTFGEVEHKSKVEVQEPRGQGNHGSGSRGYDTPM